MPDPTADKIDWQKILDNQFADERAFAGKMSDSAKFVWVGTLGLFYSAMLADKGPLADFFRAYRGWLWFAAELGAAAFLFDTVKNWAGRQLSYSNQQWLRNNWTRSQAQNFVAEYNAAQSAAKFFCFGCRSVNRLTFTLSIVASLAAAVVLGLAIALYYFGSASSAAAPTTIPSPAASAAAPASAPAK